ncbi:MAG: 16S rRNA (guanine(966)-N(2))-methyltransferase RsmD [Sphaerochaetaceae bacterium]|nr:16S rRNA (guanine(966)-N(2))-methyltransferase RsmD [Sphaerochaetaceae bacterium]MDC7248066.1 16S rRNA (guanine(966)-N(2))-methyltransferase RsmD [Sphaerochaetaceae bacterium]
MRITSGTYRGRTVICPPGVIRPAMDRMRESMFSIIGDITDCTFLDLFSGSGLVGIEAASRGAEPVHLVEMDRGKKDTIEKNISFVTSSIKLFISNVFRFIPSAKMKYDIIYADPPFPMKGKVSIAQAVEKKGLLNENGLFIVHYPREEQSLWPEKIGSLTFTDERTYGRSLLRFYRNIEKEQ